METSSSTHTSTTTTDTISSPHAPSPPPSMSSLSRMDSGTSSIILDPTTTETDSSPSSSLQRKLPSSRFKGVVPQPNGRWGAQIYEKHQRVWLGTFTDEREAALAYDVAALRFRGRDAVTNSTELASASSTTDSHEIEFLRSRSKSEIVDMLRKHTYHDELEQSRRQSRHVTGLIQNDAYNYNRMMSNGAMMIREEMFEKALTPSDVGKLNRLVIPKQHAEKHFPFPDRVGTGSADSKGMLLSLEDGEGKVWRFRYSYWNSSQSYVLTKGWSRFVKEKGLRAGDVVGFQRSKGHDKQLFVDWRTMTTKKSQIAMSSSSYVMSHSVGIKMMTNEDQHEIGQREGVLRLFGVEIKSGVGGGDSCGGKRSREIMELFATEVAGKKKPMVAVGVL